MRGLNQQRDCQGALTVWLGIIAVIAGKCPTPLCQYSLEPALGDVPLRDVFRHISEAKLLKRDVQYLEGAVEGQLPFDMDAQLAPVLLE